MKRLALLAVLAVTLSGCSNPTVTPDNTESAAVVAVETAFLAALVDGDGEAALALTTLDKEEFSCSAMVTDYSTMAIGISDPEVKKATVDGTTATVTFTYSAPTAAAWTSVNGTHTLVREGDDWLIEFPDEYRITGSIGADVVGQVGIMPADGVRDPYQCTAPAMDGIYELLALPGAYTLVTSDPTGVFYSTESGTIISVHDTAETDAPDELVYIDEHAREVVASLVGDELRPYIDLCASSGFTDPSCQDGLPVPEGKVSISDYPGLDKITIFSDDGLTWRFTAAGESFLFQRNGGIESVDIYYSGTVLPAAAGSVYLAITLD